MEIKDHPINKNGIVGAVAVIGICILKTSFYFATTILLLTTSWPFAIRLYKYIPAVSCLACVVVCLMPCCKLYCNNILPFMSKIASKALPAFCGIV